MNKHIELVEKWLADNDSVSKEELIANRNAADAAANAAKAASNINAAYWVATYHLLIKEPTK